MSDLPIDALIPRILSELERAGRAVIQAPPGAGKTTRVPLALADAPFMAGKSTIVLEPRRLAARMAARHMASLLGQDVGDTVGYRVRLDSKVGPRTRVELVTDGIFLRRLQDDPSLPGVGCVIFDEFHERGLENDLALALTIEARSALNPNLKIIVMSATLDAAPLAKLLDDAPILTSEGRVHPVETRYLQRAPVGRIEDTVARAIGDALDNEEGSLLVFLPGAREIRRVFERLTEAGMPDKVMVAPLYGDLDRKAQDAAVSPAPSGHRKIVLATSIAETSLTIEGIRVVIDSGLARVPRHDPRSGMTRLETVRASQATSDQRRGRAGRLGPGICYRLWTEHDQRARAAHPTPEMLAADLAPLALELAVWGAGDGNKLAFLDPPPAGAMRQARELLIRLGALDDQGQPTSHGKAMARLGLHPRLAHMILAGKARGLGRLAADAAAILNDRDIFRGTGRDADFRSRLAALRGERDEAASVDRGALAQARELVRQWTRLAGIGKHEGSVSPDRAGEVIALAYPDRIAQRRLDGRGQFRLVNGRGAALPEADPLASAEFLAVATLDGEAQTARIFLAAPIGRAIIEEIFRGQLATQEEVVWGARSETVAARKELRLGALVLESSAIPKPEGTAVIEAMAEGIKAMGIAALPWSDAARGIQSRIGFLRRIDGDQWPDLSDAALSADPLAWLGDRLAGLTRRGHFNRIDVADALLARLDWRQRRDLDTLAPSHVEVPTGRSVALDYAGDIPVLAVKLQEMFGVRTTPTVAGGKVAVVVQLLSPAGRPLQTTRDLQGFWQTGYAAVRAEMRGRYPRHPWPDDPLAAPPQRGVKRR